MARTHVIISEEILRRIDAIAGERGRSRFLEDAAREKLSRHDLKEALNATAGIVDPDDYPELRDPRMTAKTIRSRRRSEGG